VPDQVDYDHDYDNDNDNDNDDETLDASASISCLQEISAGISLYRDRVTGSRYRVATKTGLQLS